MRCLLSEFCVNYGYDALKEGKVEQAARGGTRGDGAAEETERNGYCCNCCRAGQACGWREPYRRWSSVRLNRLLMASECVVLLAEGRTVMASLASKSMMSNMVT